MRVCVCVDGAKQWIMGKNSWRNWKIGMKYTFEMHGIFSSEIYCDSPGNNCRSLALNAIKPEKQQQ